MTKIDGAGLNTPNGKGIGDILGANTDTDYLFERIKVPLEKYVWIQEQVRSSGWNSNYPEFRRRFNGFYRVRRGSAWQVSFFGLMDETRKTGSGISFRDCLSRMHVKTGSWEASFTSKLIATLDPKQPVIDSVVLRNLNLRLPRPHENDRAGKIVALHDQLAALFSDFIQSEIGRDQIEIFRNHFHGTEISDVKIVDLMLWQLR
jgi:hypothetical protein